jgi:hypothetical protein
MDVHIVPVPVDFTTEPPKKAHTAYNLDLDELIDEPLHSVTDMAPYFHQVNLNFGDSRHHYFMVVKDPDVMDTSDSNQLLEEYGLHVSGNIIVLELDAAGCLKEIQEDGICMAMRAVIWYAGTGA